VRPRSSPSSRGSSTTTWLSASSPVSSCP
jgi:hypothetical protein